MKSIQLPVWFFHQTLFLQDGQWLALLIFFLIAFVTVNIGGFYTGKLVGKILGRSGITISNERSKRFTRPIGVLIGLALWNALIQLIDLPPGLLTPLLRLGHILLALTAVVGMNQLVEVVFIYFEKAALRSESKFDDVLVPLIKKTIKFLVFAVGSIFVGDSLTLDMKSLLAGLGIGGLAFALAAKDTLSNLFGSLTVLIDQPFQIGDFVKLDANTEGTVEEVGLRSTRIRTGYDSVITVPNGLLTNINIDNMGKRRYRRFSTKVGVEYATPVAKIEAFCQGIRQLILKHPSTRKEEFHVYLSDLNSSSVDILVYVFWSVPDWAGELKARHEFLSSILKLGDEMGVSFAFPTQTVHLARPEVT